MSEKESNEGDILHTCLATFHADVTKTQACQESETPCARVSPLYAISILVSNRQRAYHQPRLSCRQENASLPKDALRVMSAHFLSPHSCFQSLNSLKSTYFGGITNSQSHSQPDNRLKGAVANSESHQEPNKSLKKSDS